MDSTGIDGFVADDLKIFEKMFCNVQQYSYGFIVHFVMMCLNTMGCSLLLVMVNEHSLQPIN